MFVLCHMTSITCHTLCCTNVNGTQLWCINHWRDIFKMGNPPQAIPLEILIQAEDRNPALHTSVAPANLDYVPLSR